MYTIYVIIQIIFLVLAPSFQAGFQKVFHWTVWDFRWLTSIISILRNGCNILVCCINAKARPDVQLSLPLVAATATTNKSIMDHIDSMNQENQHHSSADDTHMMEHDDSPEDSEETKARKRKERLEQNRISARESRKRKKSMIEELQRTVITLSRENKDLNERNETLRRQLMELATKYPNVVPLQAIMGQNPPPATTTDANNAAVAIPKVDDPLGGADMLADWMNLSNEPDDKDGEGTL